MTTTDINTSNGRRDGLTVRLAKGILALSLAAGGVAAASGPASADPIQGSSPCLQGTCPAASQAPASASVVDWFAARSGSGDYEEYCLLAVYDAYAAQGVDIGRAPSAVEWWGAHPAQQQTVGEPDVGDLVFWDADAYNPFGHVGIYAGKDAVWSSGERQFTGIHRFSLADRNATKPYLGFIRVA